jgi:stage V sporulation protein S
MSFPNTNSALAQELDPVAATNTRTTSALLKVSGHSRPSAVAGAIAGIIRTGGPAEMQAIGAAAINQAVKAIAIARSYLRDEQVAITFIPAFTEVLIDGAPHTAIHLLVERQH